jgi:hypothetical protein
MVITGGIGGVGVVLPSLPFGATLDELQVCVNCDTATSGVRLSVAFMSEWKATITAAEFALLRPLFVRPGSQIQGTYISNGSLIFPAIPVPGMAIARWPLGMVMDHDSTLAIWGDAEGIATAGVGILAFYH